MTVVVRDVVSAISRAVYVRAGTAPAANGYDSQAIRLQATQAELCLKLRSICNTNNKDRHAYTRLTFDIDSCNLSRESAVRPFFALTRSSTDTFAASSTDLTYLTTA